MKGVDHTGSMFLRAVVRRMKELGLNQSELARRMEALRVGEAMIICGCVLKRRNI